MSRLPDDERFYRISEAIEDEREHYRRQLERKYGPQACPVCGERYEHVEGCSEAGKPKEMDV